MCLKATGGTLYKHSKSGIYASLGCVTDALAHAHPVCRRAGRLSLLLAAAAKGLFIVTLCAQSLLKSCLMAIVAMQTTSLRMLHMVCLAAAGLWLCPVGRGGRTYAPIPLGAHTLSTKRPWPCSVSTETHPGSPETEMSATRPGALMLSVVCDHMI